MSKMAFLFWLLITLLLLLLALCQVRAPLWFTEPATVWIVQAGILLIWLMVMRFGFALQLLPWLSPIGSEEEEAERVFGPLCDLHSPSFWPWHKKRLPWLLVTGQSEQVEALMPGLIAERWQVSWQGIFLWCGEPGQITDADITWLKRHRGRRALSALLWITDIRADISCDERIQRNLWQQLKRLSELLGWRPPVYALVHRADEHDQYDRTRQSVGVCWTPGTETNIASQLDKLAPDLMTEGMIQVQQDRRWSWLLQLAQDIRHKLLSPLAVMLQPLTLAHSDVLLSGLFMMPVALPGQHTGYRDITLSPAWYEVLHQAQTYRGKRTHLTYCDWLYRGILGAIGIWCSGILVSAYSNFRLIHENNTLLAQSAAPAELPEQLHTLRELQRRTDTLLWRSREGTPIQYRFGLDQNMRQLDRLWSAWQQQSQRLMLEPIMNQLNAQLRQYVDLPAGSPERRRLAGATYQYLKAYLMLAQPERADPAFLKQTLIPLWQPPDTRISPGEWMMFSSDILDFYSRELPRHLSWQQPADSQLIASVRTLLRSQKGLRNSENTLYQSVLQQAVKRHPAVSLSDLSDDRAAGGQLFTGETLPGVFTREAWEHDVRGLIAKVAAGRQVKTDWVLEDGKMTATEVLSEEALRTRLAERYFTDYAGAWLTFLNGIQWQHSETLSDTIDQLSTLGDSQRSPLISLGKALRWQASVGQEGRTVGESLLNSAKQLVSGDNTLAGQQTATGIIRTENKPADVVAQTFAPLLAILPADENGQNNRGIPPGGLTLQDYLLQVTQVRLLLQQTTASNNPQAGVLALMQASLNNPDSTLASARHRGSLLAASLGQDWSGFAAAAFSKPLDQAWLNVQAPATHALNDAWQQRVVNSWQEAFNGRYPFAATGSDVSLPLLAHFITPQSGVIDQFINHQLNGLVEKQGDIWVPVSALQQAVDVDPAFLDAINQLSRIGRQVFAHGEANLRFDIQIRPQRNIVESTLQIDDAMLKYFNQQAEWQSFTWPDKQTANPQATLSYIPLNDSGSAALPPVTALTFNGPWAILRLLDKARSEQLDSSRWRVTWTDRSGQTLSLIMRTESYGGPLELLKLKGFKLPAMIFSPGLGVGNES